jgi:SWI/SNF-related matrix-associated actin-dependent regulator 1 of chromatin subfamily A
VIADESHYLKNAKALRTKTLLPIIQTCEKVLLLTGTPALSRPYELFNQLHIISPQIWNNEKEFCKRYCASNRKRKGFNAEQKGASNMQELHAILSGTIMIRRLKKVVLSQLPPKLRHIIMVDIPDETERLRLRYIQ